MMGVVEGIIDETEPALATRFKLCIGELIDDERFEKRRPEFKELDLKQLLELRKKLNVWQMKLIDGQDAAEGLIFGIISEIFVELPQSRSPSPFTIPLIYGFPNAKLWISRLYKSVQNSEYVGLDLFSKLRQQMFLNLCYASDIDPTRETKKPFKHAVNSNLPLDQVNDVYLDGTPFHALFNAPVPLKLTHEDRYSHMHVLGGTGAGKSTLIETLIRHDLASDDPPSIVLIDPHSDTLRKLARSDLAANDRIIILDPRDTNHPFALNPFAINRERLASYDETTREQVTAGVIQTFDYLFSSLFEMELTGKQAVYFRYLTRMLITLPDTLGRNATILDMLKFIDDAEPYMPAINALPELQRSFFVRDVLAKGSSTFKQTQEQIRYRLQAILENPTLARMFTSEESTVDFFTELNRGTVLLIDTAADFLKDGSPLFGKFIVAMLLQAISERAAIEPADRKPTFVFIDEVASVFSTNIDALLNDARKFKVGMVLAHQFLDQATPRLRASLASNTGSKFASGLSAGDARAVAADMRTTADFILAQPKLQFAAYIAGVTPQAISIPIKPVTHYERLADSDYVALIAANRRKVSLAPKVEQPRANPSPRPQPTAKPSPVQPADEASATEW